MRQALGAIVLLSFLALGCENTSERPTSDAKSGASETGGEVAKLPKKGQEGPLMVKDSAWTWAYFFASPDKASVAQLFGNRKKTLSLYKVEKVVAIRGKLGVDVKPGSTIVRLETAAKLPAAAEAKMPRLLLQGVPQHLQYTTKEQRDDLAKRSRAELPPSPDTVAVIIPIRKSAAWWALPHDERQAHFQKKGDKIGHTAIGAKYAERIYRKLYHTRYAVETTDHDFITYFEFERSHTDDFKSLLQQLRDPEQNPEWRFVDREYEIWAAKTD
jgi:hypothetical protein